MEISRKYNVALLFRKSSTFSIELVFEMVKLNLNNKVFLKSFIAKSEYEKPISVLKNLFFLKTELFFSKVHFDIYHITGVLHYLFFVLSPRKTILTIHDCIKYHQHSGISKLIIKYLWFKIPINYFKFITVVSQQTKSELIQITGCIPQKIRVIYNPINPDIQYSPKKFTLDKVRVLHIGTNPNKNLENLIAALSSINCHLTIIGKLNSSIINYLDRYQIEYCNYFNLQSQEIINQYKLCDIVSFITSYEGFGLPIIEGQGIGRVVITSAIEPHMEIGSDGAYYVNPFNYLEIRNGFNDIISNPLLRQNLIEKGLINVERFSIDLISKQYFQLYSEVINKKSK